MPLTANFLADFSSFLKACADATTSTDELVASAGKVGATMDQAVGQAAASLKNVGASVADFGQKAWSVLNSQQLRNFSNDVTSFVSGYIHEFAQAESATARLGEALKTTGERAPELARVYEEMATNLQSISRFSDEAITDTIALFTTVGKVAPEEMEKAVRATMNLALVMKVDLPTASAIMAKAMASDGESIAKLKTILGDAYVPGMNFAQVMEAINTKFGGQTLADMQTTAGTMENLKNVMSDFNENVGKVFADTLKTIFEWFQKLPEGVQTFAIGATAIGTALAPVLISLASLASLIGTMWPTAFATAGTAIGTFVGGLSAIPIAIGAAFVLIYVYLDEIVAFIEKWVKKIFYFLTESLPQAFTTSVQTITKWYYEVKYWLQDQLMKVIDFVIAGAGKIADAFTWLYNQVVGFSTVPDMIDGIAKEFGRLDRVMIAPALAAVDDVNAAFSQGIDTSLPMATLTAGGLGASGGVTVNVGGITMTGMMGTDDPQTRALLSDLVSSAVMQGMRSGRLLGTA